MRTIPAPSTGTTPVAHHPLPQTTAQQPTSRRWPGASILDSPETAHVLHSAWSGDPAVVVPSPPGAGKTRLVALLAAALAHRAQLRVGVAAQTREQATELARRIGALSDLGKLIWSRTNTPITHQHCPAIPNATFPPSGGGILIATTARWLYNDPATRGCDLMIVDESWQATYADLGALGAFAQQVVCVGDPAQIAPVVTGVTARWADRSDAPHLPAPQALMAAHGDHVAVVPLRHTWRLGAATTALIQPAFYPNLPFTSRRPPEHISETEDDPMPELAQRGAAALPEMSHRPVTPLAGPSDPLLAEACADRARSLLGAILTTTSGSRRVDGSDLAVVCAHVNQAAAVRAMLSDEPDVLVGTANQLQGLERPAVVALHPLAGYRDASTFTADTGRACVMLTRHRAHLTVVTDTNTPALLARDDTPEARAQTRLLDALTDTPTL